MTADVGASGCDHEQRGRAECQRPAPGDGGPPRCRRERGHRQPGEQHRTGRAVRPRHRAARDGGAGAGRPRDAQSREGAQPAEDRCAPGPDLRQHGSTHPGDRGRCHERRSEEVGEDADHRDGALQQHDDRRAHGLRRNGNRQRRTPRSDRRRQPPPDRVTPRPGEDQQPERRQGREREAVGPAQPRVDHEQDDHGGCQHRDAGAAARAAQADEADRPHRRCPDDRRLGSSQHDEAGQYAQSDGRDATVEERRTGTPVRWRRPGRSRRWSRSRPTGASCRWRAWPR